MLPPALDLSPLDARRFVVRALRLDRPHASVADALRHHGYIQIDPINVAGRMHDHILRNRVAGYREGDLMRHLHGDTAPLPATRRIAFEHHLPTTDILVALEPESWPHLRGAMEARQRRPGAWSGRLTPSERELAPRLLAEITSRGPLGSDAIVDARRATRVWGAATLVKSTLQKLFFHGRLLIAGRDQNRRLYDLPDRILPAAILAAPASSPAETARWEARLKLRQRRLVTLKRAELPLVEDLVQPIRVTGCPPLFCLRDDVALLDQPPAPDSAPPSIHLLAPLDPLIYDRAVTRALWDFDYTWEAYTPPAKRVRGHYAMPVLHGLELVGHVDARADRLARKLVVLSRRVRRGTRAAPAVQTLARFLGLRAR